MAKKKHKKKHSFQHKTGSSSVAAPVARVEAKAVNNEWQIVAGDVRRSLLLAGSFIVGMVVLWVVLNHGITL